VNLDGTGERRAAARAGALGGSGLAQSGRTLLYLHVPDDVKQLVTLRENDPAGRSDHLLARTSQFESVYPNADASVFVGASRSLASSYVLILLRVTAARADAVRTPRLRPEDGAAGLQPDSQSVYFVSDRHGNARACTGCMSISSWKLPIQGGRRWARG